MEQHEKWCASVPRPTDGTMLRGGYKCDCKPSARPAEQAMLAEFKDLLNRYNDCNSAANEKRLIEWTVRASAVSAPPSEPELDQREAFEKWFNQQEYRFYVGPIDYESVAWAAWQSSRGGK